MPGSLAPDVVEPLLRGRFGHPYLYTPRCTSTQRLLAGDLPEGAVAVCDQQTAGRGRRGRAWEAPPGTSLLVSLTATARHFYETCVAAGAIEPLAELCRRAARACTAHTGGAATVEVVMVDFEGEEVIARG